MHYAVLKDQEKQVKFSFFISFFLGRTFTLKAQMFPELYSKSQLQRGEFQIQEGFKNDISMAPDVSETNRTTSLSFGT